MSITDIQIDIQKMMCYELLKEIGKYKNFGGGSKSRLKKTG